MTLIVLKKNRSGLDIQLGAIDFLLNLFIRP